MREINLYLDLDGVILRRTGRTVFGGRTEFNVAPNAMEFLSWAVDNFTCHWLTSRFHDGTYDGIERSLRFAISTANLPNETIDLIRAIRPARWRAEKFSGINLSEDFYWVDDDPDQVSVDVLKQAGLSPRLIIASTDERPDDLDRVKKLLARKTFNQRDVAKLQTFHKEINKGGKISDEMAQWWWDRY